MRKPASTFQQSLAVIVDVAILLAVFCLTEPLFKLSMRPGITWALLLLTEAIVLWVLERLVFKKTLGEWSWRLQARDTHELVPIGMPVQANPPSLPMLFTGGILTAFAWFVFSLSFDHFWTANPLLAKTPSVSMQAFTPTSEEFSQPSLVTLHQSPTWMMAPFFYTLGSWPRSFENAPIFYELPYEKGPPLRFVGHIVARWEAPDIKVTLEGPKTSELKEVDFGTRGKIKKCLVRGLLTPTCLNLREATLARHINEMQRLSPRKWRISWFEVDNAVIPEAERPQGVYISAQNGERFEERYILITARSTHQTMMLSSAHAPLGKLDGARELFQKAIRSLRVLDELNSGKAWVDREIQDTRLEKFAKKDIVSRFQKVQTLLVSKISVDPGTFETYFHLAGTSLILAKSENRLGTVAKLLVQNAYRYAQDLAPLDPRIAQMESFWADAQKF